jgi:hypothetical protein
MKIVALFVVCIYILGLSCTRKLNAARPDTFIITDIEGSSQDAKKVFFWSKEDISPQKNLIYASCYVKYWADLNIYSDSFYV